MPACRKIRHRTAGGVYDACRTRRNRVKSARSPRLADVCGGNQALAQGSLPSNRLPVCIDKRYCLLLLAISGEMFLGSLPIFGGFEHNVEPYMVRILRRRTMGDRFLMTS